MVSAYHALAFEYVIDYLVAGAGSEPANLDPIGELNLKLAKKVRRLAMARGGAEDPEHLHQSANEFFPMPQEELVYWPRRESLDASTDPDGRGATPITP